MREDGTSEASAPRNPVLNALLHEARENLEVARASYQSADTTVLRWRATERSWCAAEILDHLVAVSNEYHPRIRAALVTQRGSVPSRRKAYRPSTLMRFLLWTLAPQRRWLRLPAPRPAFPRRQLDPALTWNRFEDTMGDLLSLIIGADGSDLNGGKFVSPFSSLLNLSVGEALSMIVVHQQRHLEQLKSVIQQAGGGN